MIGLGQGWSYAYPPFGLIDQEHGFDVKQTIDSNYIVCGTSYSYTVNAPIGNQIISSNQNGTLWKVNSNGIIEWTKYFGHNNDSILSFRSIEETVDGGYITVGVLDSIYLILIKTDILGNKEWEIEIEDNFSSSLVKIIKAVNNSFYFNL